LALMCGLMGYLFHRLWIGIGLGTVLAGWAFLATWVLLKAPSTFGWPAVSGSGSFRDHTIQLWDSLPSNVAQLVPTACGGAMGMGLIITIFWPRLAVATAWSAAGASLLAGLGSAAMEFSRPQWLRIMPQQFSSQMLGLGVLTVVGVAAQWKTAQLAAGQAGPVSGKPSGTKGKPSPRPISEGAD
jgi:hypothetical protein